ncbi:MAG: hypothetical protein CL607_10110 [Anaerolineaceae bacterium]|nr:hypothetical protein [Anaerolineaceae bacterium]
MVDTEIIAMSNILRATILTVTYIVSVIITIFLIGFVLWLIAPKCGMSCLGWTPIAPMFLETIVFTIIIVVPILITFLINRQLDTKVVVKAKS